MRTELIAVLIALRDEGPMVLTLDQGRALPSGPLEAGHRSLQTGLRLWVERQTGHQLGHVEQLYTFADATVDEHDDMSARAIRISYLALTRAGAGETGWCGWYDYFPWEDQTNDAGRDCAGRAGALLYDWAGRDETTRRRVSHAFGLDPHPWDDELVLQRYELLWQAGLVPESGGGSRLLTGRPMARDHRRVLATGMARLRAKIRYRPLIFELLPPHFTLLELQRTVEAVSGRLLHKQNFRRQITQQALVEETGGTTDQGPGRPARLFRFRPSAVDARGVSGTRLPRPGGARSPAG